MHVAWPGRETLQLCRVRVVAMRQLSATTYTHTAAMFKTTTTTTTAAAEGQLHIVDAHPDPEPNPRGGQRYGAFAVLRGGADVAGILVAAPPRAASPRRGTERTMCRSISTTA